MRLFKPSNQYPEWLSKQYVFLKLHNIYFTIHEEYDPHFLKIYKWVKDKDDNIFILKKWIHIPLNRYARYINRKAREYNDKCD